LAVPRSGYDASQKDPGVSAGERMIRSDGSIEGWGIHEGMRGEGIENTRSHLAADHNRYGGPDPPFGGYTAGLYAVTFSTSPNRLSCSMGSEARPSTCGDFDRNILKLRIGQHMYVPSVVERVRVKGSDEVFLVTRIDRQSENAHLIALRGSSDDQIDVPFAEIFPSVLPKRRKKNI
jgi:hypothetical protein